jgi:hypothetical protein
MVEVVHGASVEVGGGIFVLLDGVSVSVTGQTVVYKETMSVVTEPFSGQSVTVDGHSVMVYTEVVYTVEVVDGLSSPYAPALTAAATPRRERTEAFILRGGRLILKIEV